MSHSLHVSQSGTRCLLIQPPSILQLFGLWRDPATLWLLMTSHGFSATGSSRRHQLGCSCHRHAPTWV